MISIICPSCGSKLNAKDELAGQTRKCPKCSTPVKIVPPDAPPESPTLPTKSAETPETSAKTPGDQHVQSVRETSLPAFRGPERLDRQSQYVICDRSRVVALWQSNGKGWQLKTGVGMLPAVRNRDQLPTQGDFKLIEFKINATEAGKRLVALTSYQLAKSWALTSLAKGDDAILSKIVGPGCFSRDLKALMRVTIKDLFMHETLESAKHIFEFLESTDYHSPGTEGSSLAGMP
jgi:hypothetical protein